MRALGRFILLMATIAVVTVSSTTFAEDDQPPLWSLPDTFDAVEDVPVTYDMAEYVNDPDTPLENLSVESGSPLVENITGMLVTFLFPNGVLEANVTILASDGNATVGAVLHFLVEPVNDPPRFEPRYDRLPDGEQDLFYSFNLTSVDEDNSQGELEYSTDATFFTMFSGEIAFTPKRDVVGYNYFNVSVSDPDGLNDTMELLLVIGPYNVWHVEYIPPQQIEEDELFSLDISAYLYYDFLRVPPEERLTFTYRDDSSKIETDPVTGIMTWTPTNDDIGDHFFTITVTDSEGRSDQQEIRIRVPDPGPDPPPYIPRQSLTQGERYVFDVPIDGWYYHHPEIMEEMEFSNEPIDLFRVDPYTGRIDFVPGNEDVGSWEIDITVKDPYGMRSTRTVIFEVKNVNDPPLLESMGVQVLTEGEPVKIELTAHDPDLVPRRADPNATVDPNESLRFSGGPPGTSVNPATGVLEFVPDQDHVNASPMTVSFTVEDARGDSDVILVQIHVLDVVVSPRVAILGLVEGQKLTYDRRYLMKATSWDETGQSWAEDFKWYSGTTLIGTGTTCEWRPKRGGWYELKLVGEGGDGARAEDTVLVVVKEGPHGPKDDGWPIVVAVIALVVIVLLVLNRRRIASYREGKGRSDR